jgi:hypothetical protein
VSRRFGTGGGIPALASDLEPREAPPAYVYTFTSSRSWPGAWSVNVMTAEQRKPCSMAGATTLEKAIEWAETEASGYQARGLSVEIVYPSQARRAA